MTDPYGRGIRYLRVSVTERCNLRCRYCVPANGPAPRDGAPQQGEALRGEETLRLVRVMAGLGIERVRLTGGEALTRGDLPALAAAIKAVPGIRFLGLTTNGILLPPLAQKLRDAGVDGVNVSLDTLNEERYTALTGGGALSAALAGLHAALAAPFPAVKINCVLAPQSLPEDWLSLAALAKRHKADLRFIEWMPLGGEGGAGVSGGKALRALALRYGVPRPLSDTDGGGPAGYWRFPGFAGRVGLIRAMSRGFCESCNRLRLSASGFLRLCLFYDTGLPLMPLLRGGANDAAIAAAIAGALKHKPKGHLGRPYGDETKNAPAEAGGMCGIGG